MWAIKLSACRSDNACNALALSLMKCAPTLECAFNLLWDHSECRAIRTLLDGFIQGPTLDIMSAQLLVALRASAW